jgi:3-methyladenine DNA glycosylase AlkD
LRKSNTKLLKQLEEEIAARLAASSTRSTAQIRAVRREFSRRLAHCLPEFIFQLALRIIKRPGLDHRFLAYELIQHHKRALQSLNGNKLEQLGRAIDSWVAVDCFACYLAGPAWRERQVQDSLLLRWSHSKDRWWRRAALVSTVPLNSKARGGSGDAARTLRICEALVQDRDDMVVKALSWSLRELAKREPQSVQEFLVKHRDVLAARVAREVNNKLTTGLKNARPKKSKVTLHVQNSDQDFGLNIL